MKSMRLTIVLMTLAIATVSGVKAQPNFAGIQRIGDLTVFPDVQDRSVFYYVPGPIRMEERNGMPMFDFLQTRYTGSALRGDQGDFRIFSQVTLSVKTKPIDEDVLRAAAIHLGWRGRTAELRPVPLSRLEADLVYALPGADSPSSIAGDSVEVASSNARWYDQTFTIRLNDVGSMALWQSLQDGRAIMSFAYAYVAAGVDRPFEQVETGGNVSASEWRADSLAPPMPESGSIDRVVYADAFNIELDPELHPEHFTRVDLNGDRVPPGYAAIAVRCYDFKDGLRDDLWEKILEIEAESVSGRPSRISMHFSIDDVRIYKHSARFPYAVRLDRPYRYRVTEITLDGDELVGPWVERDSWVEPLDVTTPIERVFELRAAHETEELRDQ